MNSQQNLLYICIEENRLLIAGQKNGQTLPIAEHLYLNNEIQGLHIVNMSKVILWIRSYIHVHLIVDARTVIAIQGALVDEQLGTNTLSCPISAVAKTILDADIVYQAAIPYFVRSQLHLLAITTPFTLAKIITVTIAQYYSIDDAIRTLMPLHSINHFKKELTAHLSDSEKIPYFHGLKHCAHEGKI